MTRDLARRLALLCFWLAWQMARIGVVLGGAGRRLQRRAGDPPDALEDEIGEAQNRRVCAWRTAFETCRARLAAR